MQLLTVDLQPCTDWPEITVYLLRKKIIVGLVTIDPFKKQIKSLTMYGTTRLEVRADFLDLSIDDYAVTIPLEDLRQVAGGDKKEVRK